MLLLQKVRSLVPWLPSYMGQRCTRRLTKIRPLHLILGVADHFEPMTRSSPSAKRVSRHEQLRRVEKWCDEYPKAVAPWRDAEGQPFRHTYFYPAEEYDSKLIERLAEHCHSGWGEMEIHLHHGVDAPDSPGNTKRTLAEFRDELVALGCLSRADGKGPARYGFVHGNWALANSDHGQYCGVDEEMQILADTGCYADFTLPARTSAQVCKINAMYECGLPLDQRAPHRQGRDLRCGQAPNVYPLIMQGPLLIDFKRRKPGRRYPCIESGELSGANPPTMRRLRLWQESNITVHGRPDWCFIKLHCHGMEQRDEAAMFGAPMQDFLQELVEGPGNGTEYHLHFVTMREMANIALAACDGRKGNPGEYRNYRFRLNHPPAEARYHGVV